jgi:hypothetical protein
MFIGLVVSSDHDYHIPHRLRRRGRLGSFILAFFVPCLVVR